MIDIDPSELAAIRGAANLTDVGRFVRRCRGGDEVYSYNGQLHRVTYSQRYYTDAPGVVVPSSRGLPPGTTAAQACGQEE
jgi:hypothetical protein